MILLDSDVIIAFLRGEASAVRLVDEAIAEGEELATTSINVGEVLRGERSASRRRTASAMLSSLAPLGLDESVGERYGAFMARLDKAGKTIPALDGFIAAAALENGAAVATLNAKHFAPVPGLDVVTPE